MTKDSSFISSKVIPDSDFLGDNNCKKCHQQEFKDWQGSHHDKAMQIADSLTVLADFNNKIVTSQSVTSRFYKEGSDF
ncbi:multiheme c-type cytochrome [Yeosuana aromativorans]|uniref:multiheme c-type cytochrome n=1 Tax=Yeosuana aromativorans TaxID=288019 RepID=UPI0027E56AB6|nr:multiheme c-type cytochrome [Yeosuana aromativorans]